MQKTCPTNTNTGAALKEGCKRYVEVMTGDKPKFESGSMPMSGYPAPCKCCAWSGCGPMYDNRKIGPYFRDEKLCKAATDKVRAANEKWAESKGVKLTFGKVSAANQALNAAKGGNSIFHGFGFFEIQQRKAGESHKKNLRRKNKQTKNFQAWPMPRKLPATC